MATNLKGAPQPKTMQTIAAIRADDPTIGMNGAMQRATDIQRKWAVDNGLAD